MSKKRAHPSRLFRGLGPYGIYALCRSTSTPSSGSVHAHNLQNRVGFCLFYCILDLKIQQSYNVCFLSIFFGYTYHVISQYILHNNNRQEFKSSIYNAEFFFRISKYSFDLEKNKSFKFFTDTQIIL